MLANIATQTAKSIVTATEAVTSLPLSMHLHHHHFNHNDISRFLLLMMLPISFTCYQYFFYCTNTVITLHCCHLYLAHTTITLPTTFTSIVTTKTPMSLECLFTFFPTSTIPLLLELQIQTLLIPM